MRGRRWEQGDLERWAGPSLGRPEPLTVSVYQCYMPHRRRPPRGPWSRRLAATASEPGSPIILDMPTMTFFTLARGGCRSP